MSSVPQSAATFSPQRTFVVQLREGAPPVAERFNGRAEHIVSGEVAYFESPDELLAFIERVLKSLREG